MKQILTVGEKKKKKKKKNEIPASSLDKPLSNFVCPGQVLN